MSPQLVRERSEGMEILSHKIAYRFRQTASGAVRSGHLVEKVFFAILFCSNRRQVSHSVSLLPLFMKD